jgi:hypothetical protein
MKETTIRPEPNCPYFKDEDARAEMTKRVAQVAQMLSQIFVEACSGAELCREAAIATMHELILAITSGLATCNAPGIEAGSEEARWESEHLLNGIEGRLLESLRLKYKMFQALSPDERAEIHAMLKP